jgi:hypothetical protein
VPDFQSALVIAQAMDLRHRALLERLQFLQSEAARLEEVLA